MSVKLDIFNDIHTAITANVTAIKDVFIWNGQIDAEKEEKSKAYPLIYVEFSNMSWDKTSLRPQRLSSIGSYKNEQKGSFTITIHIVFWKLTDETTAFSEIDATIELVMFALLGLNGTYYNPLLRTGEVQDVNHDDVIDWQINFDCGVSQCAQEDTSFTKINAGTLSITTTADLDIDNIIIRTGDGTA